MEFVREGVRVLTQALMYLGVSWQIGAQLRERPVGLTTNRYGYLECPWDTLVGTIDLQIPKLGSHRTSLLEPHRRAENVLGAIVQQAFVQGGSTRRVEYLTKALWMTGVSSARQSSQSAPDTAVRVCWMVSLECGCHMLSPAFF